MQEIDQAPEHAGASAFVAPLASEGVLSYPLVQDEFLKANVFEVL